MAENTKRYVLDTSVVTALLAPDESSQPLALKVATLIEDARNFFYAPELQKFEVLNSLKSLVKQKRYSQQNVGELVTTFQVFPSIVVDIDQKQVLDLALKHDLTAYDASYLWVANKMDAKLITKDKQLLVFSPLPKEWELS